MMVRIFKSDQVEVWQVNERWGTDYWVYGVTTDPRVCPSLGMAYEILAAAIVAVRG
jgi:hypothetical protein